MTVKEIRKIEKTEWEWTRSELFNLISQMANNKRNLWALENMGLEQMISSFTYYRYCDSIKLAICTKECVNSELASYAYCLELRQRENINFTLPSDIVEKTASEWTRDELCGRIRYIVENQRNMMALERMTFEQMLKWLTVSGRNSDTRKIGSSEYVNKQLEAYYEKINKRWNRDVRFTYDIEKAVDYVMEKGFAVLMPKYNGVFVKITIGSSGEIVQAQTKDGANITEWFKKCYNGSRDWRPNTTFTGDMLPVYKDKSRSDLEEAIREKEKVRFDFYDHINSSIAYIVEASSGREHIKNIILKFKYRVETVEPCIDGVVLYADKQPFYFMHTNEVMS